ncbi:nicotinamide-nucleotide amidase [Lewinella marina]|uniref:CinA-like protein n=1 Tax=Neolewinella marina TaxID=438751 RepID=A0A2G0CB36_9BACT|nr:competence/damage-inducible protein A [Neolewinella marina]NJB86814.1 nicotinamide-nucleotide amidase [Neolewinella marina]PHK97176.1 competence/damage-inducible protein A [Neolewinella marina]
MQATILTVGDEILIGQVIDTNATFMAAALSAEGITVVEHLSVGDNRMAIMGGLERALQQSDLVLMTGGLGPTKDDITKQVLADYFGAELRLHNPTWKRLQKIYARLGRECTEHHRQQCRLPTGAKVLPNEHGTAPGLWLEKEDQIVVSMPGVPHEMVYLMEHEVIRRIQKRNLDAELLRSVTLLTAGAGESTIAERLERIEDNLPENMSLAYLPDTGTVRLRLSARGQVEALLQAQLDEYRNHIEGALGNLVYGYGNDNLASMVGRRLEEREQTVATAESCTGGALGHMITIHPGSSKHFLGGIIAYSNDVKMGALGVPEETLDKYGAVSEETVTAMAEGARERLGATYALATSGIAGPGGGTQEKPVGTIWIALATPNGTRTKLLRNGKDRARNITYTCHHALNLLRLELTDVPDPAPQPKAKPKPKRKPRAKATPKVDPQPEAEATPKAPAKAKRSPKAATKPKPKAKAKPKAETETKPQEEVKAKPKRRPIRKK